MRLSLGLALASTLAACSGESTPPGGDPASARTVALRIDPPNATRVVVLGQDASVMLHAFATTDDGRERDVTAEAAWSISGAPIAAVTAPGVLTTAGLGGKAEVRAALADASAAASLAVTLTGDVGGDPSAFGVPLDDAHPIALEYPASGVVVPANVPPLEVQWGNTTDTLFRVRVTSADVLDLHLYTRERELLVPPDVWSKMAATAPDAPISVVVEGVDGAGHLHRSAAQTMTITAERLPQGGIYAHDCAHGGLVAVDVVRGAESPLPTDSPANLDNRIGRCAGCHNVSRDGRRIGFVNIDNGFFGALRFDAARRLFSETITPTATHAPSVAFNPLEATTRPAMLTAFAIPSQKVSGLWLVDPDTNASLPTDLAQMLAAVPASAGQGATMPAWSSKGGHVLFSASPTSGTGGSQPTQGCAQCSLVEAPVTYDGSQFHFGAPDVIVPAAPGETNLRGSYDDDTAIAFTRIAGAGVGDTLLYRRADRRLIPFRAGAADATGAWGNLAPDWGPSGARYAWLVVPSNRPYGHRGTTAQSFHLWVFAVDRAKLAAGEEDPSATPFWASGQSADGSYVRPQWPRWMPP